MASLDFPGEESIPSIRGESLNKSAHVFATVTHLLQGRRSLAKVVASKVFKGFLIDFDMVLDGFDDVFVIICCCR